VLSLPLDTASLDAVTLADYLRDRLRHPGVREVVAAVVRLTGYANAPEALSAGAALEQLRLGLGRGVRYLDGGWSAMGEALARSAREAGVELRCGARVERVEHDGQVRAAARGRQSASPATPSCSLGPDEASALVDEGAIRSWPAPRAPAAGCALPRPGARAPAAAQARRLRARHRPRDLLLQCTAVGEARARGNALIRPRAAWRPTNRRRARRRGRVRRAARPVQPGWRELTLARDDASSWSCTICRTPRAQRIAGRTPGAVDRIANLFLAGDWVGPTGMLADELRQRARGRRARRSARAGSAWRHERRRDGERARGPRAGLPRAAPLPVRPATG
jgi:hypothetical protein